MMKYSCLCRVLFLILLIFQNVSLASDPDEPENEGKGVVLRRGSQEEMESFFRSLQETPNSFLKERVANVLRTFLPKKLSKSPVSSDQLRTLLEQHKKQEGDNTARLARTLGVPYSTLYDFLNSRTLKSPSLSKKLPVIISALFPVKGIGVLRDIGCNESDFSSLRCMIEEFDFSGQNIVHSDLFERMSTDTGTSVRSTESVCADLETILTEAPPTFHPSINFSGNCIERGIGPIVRVLQRYPLKALNLSHANLSEEHVKTLAPLVVQPFLERLDVRGNIGANVLTFEYLKKLHNKENPDLEILWKN